MLGYILPQLEPTRDLLLGHYITIQQLVKLLLPQQAEVALRQVVFSIILFHLVQQLHLILVLVQLPQ